MKLLLLVIISVLSADFYDIDKSEAVQIPKNGSARIRISIQINAGVTYIPANFEPKLTFDSLIGTLVAGTYETDYQFFEIFCTRHCEVGDDIIFNLIQTQGTHLGGHILHPVHVTVVQGLN